MRSTERLDGLRPPPLLQRGSTSCSGTVDRGADPATDGNGCITSSRLGCAQGYQFAGVNALVVSPKAATSTRASLTSKQRHDVPPDRRRGPPTGPAAGENIPEGPATRAAAWSTWRAWLLLARDESARGLALAPDATNLYVPRSKRGDGWSSIATSRPGRHTEARRTRLASVAKVGVALPAARPA